MTYELPKHEERPLEKYSVMIEKSVYATVYVMAESPEDAAEKAYKLAPSATYEEGQYFEPEVVEIDKVA